MAIPLKEPSDPFLIFSKSIGGVWDMVEMGFPVGKVTMEDVEVYGCSPECGPEGPDNGVANYYIFQISMWGPMQSYFHSFISIDLHIGGDLPLGQFEIV